jgi:hypothetical protein
MGGKSRSLPTLSLSKGEGLFDKLGMRIFFC